MLMGGNQLPVSQNTKNK